MRSNLTISSAIALISISSVSMISGSRIEPLAWHTVGIIDRSVGALSAVSELPRDRNRHGGVDLSRWGGSAPGGRRTTAGSGWGIHSTKSGRVVKEQRSAAGRPHGRGSTRVGGVAGIQAQPEVVM